MPPSPKVKICCISSIGEAQLAIELGASALGLVTHMPSGPGVITESLIAEIAATVPPSIDTFLLTSLVEAAAIAEQHQRCRTTTLQLVDFVEPAELTRLRQLLPTVRLVQVIHVMNDQSMDEARQAAGFVDAILLDSGNPTLETKELGGTGRVHDWEISRRICEELHCPVYLAGGLTPANVGEAIRSVKPYAVDLCSGVRTNNKLDEQKLNHFMQAVHG